MEKQASLFVKSVAKGAREKYNKAKRTYTCRSLKELIKAYRACTTSAEERALVKDESSHIRDLFREGDTTFRRRNIAKLLFFHMNGYPTDFGMKECIGLCGSDKFSDKRVAYLGIMILVDETRDILMLITNSLKQDLCHADQHVIALALTVLANLASADISRDLLPEVEKHLESPNAYIRKKAALAAVRAVRKLPHDETPNVLVSAPRLFETRQSGAHLANTALLMALARQHPSNIALLRSSAVPAMLSILRDLLMGTGGSSRGAGKPVSGVKNPFMQVKILQTLRVVARGAPREVLEPISDILAQVASNTDTSRLSGTAVLYECVRTIVALNVDSSLFALAVSTLGQFLSHKDPNVRYISLQELVKVVSSGCVDTDVEQYRGTITECLKEPDPSIRHRALELLHAIARAENAVEICNEFVSFLATTDDSDLRESACVKLCDLISRFSPSSEWRCDTFMRALREVDVLMPERYVSSFIAWVSSEQPVWSYSARSAYSIGLPSSGGEGSVPDSLAAVSALVDPFDSLGQGPRTPAGRGPTSECSDTNGTSRDGPAAASRHANKRKPRLERVSVYLFGEYGDRLVDAHAGQERLSADEALSVVETVLNSSNVDVSCFPASVLQIDPEDDAFEREVGMVRDACMAALVKLAVRLSFRDSKTDGVESGVPSLGMLGAPSSNGNFSASLSGQMGLLALTDGNASEPTSMPGGLGTDLLESLGIGENALVVAATPKADSVAEVVDTGGHSNPFGDSLLLQDGEHAAHPIVARVRRTLEGYRTSIDVESQQRASEYSSILQSELASLQAAALGRMPPMNYAAIHERLTRDPALRYADSLDEPQAVTPFSEDLLSLLEEDDVEVPRAQPPAISGIPEVLGLPSIDDEARQGSAEGQGSFALDDILRESIESRARASDLSALAGGGSTFSAPPDDEKAAPPHILGNNALDASVEGDEGGAGVGRVGSASIMTSSTLFVSANFYKEASDPLLVRVEFAFKNVSSEDMSHFVFQLAVPKYMSTEMRPPSSSDIPVGGTIHQTVFLNNSLQGHKPVQLRYRIQYVHGNGEEIREQGAVSPDELPAGL